MNTKGMHLALTDGLLIARNLIRPSCLIILGQYDTSRRSVFGQNLLKNKSGQFASAAGVAGRLAVILAERPRRLSGFEKGWLQAREAALKTAGLITLGEGL